MSNISVLIMAGGKGERFWPKSRKNKPKQFLCLTDNKKSMIQQTFERIKKFTDIKDIYVITNKIYKNLVVEQLPDVIDDNILCEPEGKNTAPAIAFFAGVLSKKYKDSVMVILSSDHLIENNIEFLNILKKAVKKAEEGENLITLGITPYYAETGYGYIKYDKNSADNNGIYKVEKFIEKPNKEKAEEYLATGSYLWNSGMFVWKTSTIIDKFKENMPLIYNGVEIIRRNYGSVDFEKNLIEFYNICESESIDYGIMEKVDSVYTIPSNIGWKDVGSWLSVDSLNKKDENNNVILGECITVDSKNITVVGEDRLIAVLGLEDIIIVDTGSALLVCKKGEEQKVKEILKKIKDSGRTEYL